MTISIWIFIIMLNIILTNLKAKENKKFRFDMAVKSLYYNIKKCFYSKKKYRYIAD